MAIDGVRLNGIQNYQQYQPQRVQRTQAPELNNTNAINPFQNQNNTSVSRVNASPQFAGVNAPKRDEKLDLLAFLEMMFKGVAPKQVQPTANPQQNQQRLNMMA